MSGAKRFLVYLCDNKGKPAMLEGEYETVHEVRAHPWRLGRVSKSLVDGKFYLTPGEFDAWAPTQR
jgi:hypothetical protein